MQSVEFFHLIMRCKIRQDTSYLQAGLAATIYMPLEIRDRLFFLITYLLAAMFIP